jgi:hypothetical protein
MTYLVYINELRSDDTSYRKTKKRCSTLAEAETEQKRLMEKTGKFHEIREQVQTFKTTMPTLFSKE